MINNLQSILTQNALCTESPIYAVYSKKPIVVNENYDYDEVVYMRGDYELDSKEFEKLEDQYNLASEESYNRTSYSGEIEATNKFPDDPFDAGEKFDPDDWDRLCIKMIDCFEQAFFIRENAENFLASQRHNLGENAFIYVESAYRNSEWQQIRELLIAAAKKEENIFGQLKFGLKYEDIVDGMWVVYSELPHSNYANSLKRLWKTEKGWREQTVAVTWEEKYEQFDENWSCDLLHIWDEKNYAPVDYDRQISPVDFMNKVLPLTIKGSQDA
jgi:hypothetical protein